MLEDMKIVPLYHPSLAFRPMNRRPKSMKNSMNSKSKIMAVVSNLNY